ncbi:UMP kinase [Thermoproteota archaeon]
MKTYIISLGGSIIFPDSKGPDSKFIKDFKKLVSEKVSEGNKFVIICGGGYVNKMYNKAFKDIVGPKADDGAFDETLDWIGITSIYMNAFFMRCCLYDIGVYDKIMENPTEKIETDKPIIVGCGWKPGCSSDKDAVMAAKTFGADTVINLSNVDHVYDKDPHEAGAKKIEKMTWDELIGIMGEEWSPKLNFPFDPSAAKLSKEIGLKVIIAKGTDLDNLRNILEEKEFKGTTIK